MWNEIVKNEIWEMDDFLNEETVEHIKKEMFKAASTELEPGEAILPNFRKSGVNATTYNYTVHRTDIHKNQKYIDIHMNKVNELLETLQRAHKFHHKYNYDVKVVIDKVGVFDIIDIDVSIDADYNEIYINAVKEKSNV